MFRLPSRQHTRRSFVPCLAVLEDRCTPTTISGNTITLDDANEVLTIFTNTAGTYTLESTTDIDGVTGPVSFTPAAGPVVIVDAATGTGVSFTGSAATYANPFEVTLDTAPGAVSFSGISAFGDHSVSVTTDRNISVSSGASVTAVAGAITLSANQQVTPTAGNFVGIDVRGAVTGGTGAVLVSGRGGNGASGSQFGVAVRSGGTVSTTGSGGVTVSGTGGPSTGSSNAGVVVAGANSLISSGGGNVSVTGVGGKTGVNGTHYGVTLNSGATITAGGSGSVTVHGTGGGTTSAFNGDVHGVLVIGPNARITSSGGDVSVTGISGPSEPTGVAVGMWVTSGGEISAGGMGAVSVLGVGEYGVFLTSSGIITSGGGSVNVVGTATDVIDSSGMGTGVVVAGTITAGGNGSVTVTGTGGGGAFNFTHGVWVTGSGATITSNGGSVTVTGVAGGDGTNSADVGVRLSGGGVITAGGAGTVTVQGTGGGGSGVDNHGVQILDANSAITSGGGAVSVIGIAGSGTGGVAVSVTGNGTAASGGTGSLTLTADSVALDATAIVRGGAVGTGRVTIRPLTTGTRISLGGADVLTGSPLVLGLTDAELDRIAAGTIVLGSADTGDIMLAGPVSVGIPLHLITSGGVVDGTAGEQDDLFAPSLAIEAGTGVGSGNSVNVAVGTLAIANGTSGHVRVTNNQFSAAAPLSLGVVDGVTGIINSGADIDITQSGDLTVAAAVGGAAAVNLQVDGNLTLSAPLTAAGAVSLTASGSVVPTYLGTDVTTGSGLSFGPGTPLGFAVTGTVADVQYPRLIASGAVNLTGASLALSGSYVPVVGDTFTIVSATTLTGTFVGLPHGSVVTLNGVALHVLYTGTTVTLVVNRAPTGVSAGGPYTVSEGGGLTVTAPAATDPDGDTITYTWDVNGDGTFGDEASGTVSNGGRTVAFTAAQLTALGLNDGPRTVTTLAVRASDGLVGGTTTATGVLTINNVAPTINVSGAAGVNEGTTYTLTLGAVTDPGTDTVSAFRVNWGDGTSDTYTTTGAKTHTYADDGVYTITVDLTDEDGTFLNAGNPFSVTVANVAPSVTPPGSVPGATEGAATTFALGSFTDPAGVNDGPYAVLVDWGDGTSDTFTAAVPGSLPALSHTYADSGVYTVTVQVSEAGSGPNGSSSFGVTVANVAPTPAIAGPTTGVEGSPLTFTASATDPAGVHDPITFTWSVTKNGSPFASGSGVSITFTPDDNGTYVASLTATDDDGGSATVTRTVTVNNAAPAITAFNVPGTGVGGKPVSVSAVATDPAGANDPLTFSWAVSHDGVPVASGSGPAFTFTPSVGGTFVVAVTVTDGDGGVATASDTVVVTPPPRVVTAVGNTVRVFNPLDESVHEFTPYPGFSGGVTVATADLNGDGLLDIVTGAGAGGGPHVKVFDGTSGAEVASFFAFSAGFSGGVFVAAGGGRIVIGAGAGGGPHVKAFSLDGTETASFYAYDAAFTGGVRVAVGDVNEDGIPDIVTGAGAGGGPHVKMFDGASLAETVSFFAFDAAFTGGVFVAATNGRVAVGADAGGSPHAKTFVGATGVEELSFYAYDVAFTGGVRVGFADENADGQPDLLTGAGPGGGPHMKAFNIAPFTEVESVYVGDPTDTRGVFV